MKQSNQTTGIPTSSRNGI